MRAMPVPRRFDDRPQFGVARPPAQLALDLLGRSNQNGWIPGSAWRSLDRHTTVCHRLHRLDHLADAVTTAGTQVVGQSLSRLQTLQGEQMRLGQVIDVNIVAYTGTIRSRVVGS